MPQRDTLIIDIASCGLENAADFIDRGDIKPPVNYTKPETIAAYVETEYQRRVMAAGLDMDLARVSCIGYQAGHDEPTVIHAETDHEERTLLDLLGGLINGAGNHGVAPTLITYGGTHFDLPLLMRRARYLGVAFPVISTDRYRSPNKDLLAILSDNNPDRRRSLGWYTRRLGWSDLVKPLSGAEEALAPQRGAWPELEASVRHDVMATYRLAQWLGVMELTPATEAVI